MSARARQVIAVAACALVVCSLASGALAGCVDVATLSAKCNDAHPCPDGAPCVDGLCTSTPAPIGEGEGEGDAGEGDVGEGEGDEGEGEGEGDPGEGEGDVGEGEGEGDTGEGEGEGDAGEGEGDEGEGEGEIGPICSAHDEDGDGVGDSCDVCPADSDANQLDGDGDGVGNACDPRPDVGGDFIAFFDAFDGGALAPEWSQTGTGFSVLGDALVSVGTVPQEEGEIVAADLGGADVVVRGPIVPTTLADEGDASLFTRRGEGSSAVFCGISSDDDTPDFAFMLQFAEPGVAETGVIEDLVVGARYDVQLSTVGSDYLCEVDGVSVAADGAASIGASGGYLATGFDFTSPFFIAYGRD